MLPSMKIQASRERERERKLFMIKEKDRFPLFRSQKVNVLILFLQLFQKKVVYDQTN